MTAPANPLPEPLEFSPLAQGLLYSFHPKGLREILLAKQAAWAAAHLLNMMGDAPAQPDAAWLRLFTTADRIYHRNLRQLDHLQAHRPAEAPVAAAPPAPTPAPANQPASSTSPATTRPRPSHSSSRRPDPSQRPRPNLDLIPQHALAPQILPVSITPTPAAPAPPPDPSTTGASPPAPR
jgi:hypothetical protein